MVFFLHLTAESNSLNLFIRIIRYHLLIKICYSSPGQLYACAPKISQTTYFVLSSTICPSLYDMMMMMYTRWLINRWLLITFHQSQRLYRMVRKNIALAYIYFWMNLITRITHHIVKHIKTITEQYKVSSSNTDNPVITQIYWREILFSY